MFSSLVQGKLAVTKRMSYTGRMDIEHPASTVPVTPGPHRRTGGRSARIKAAVFEATLHILQEKGYEALNFATIGEQAGVHETTLYRRWKTRERLVAEAMANLVARDIPAPDTGELRTDLIQLLQFLRAFLLSTAGQALIQAGMAARNAPAIGSFYQDYWRRRSTLLRPLFERAIARGELSPQTDIPLLFETLIGVFYIRTFLLDAPLDETLPERIVDLVLAGVYLGKPV